jgi:DNA-directed RNA polymerase subunit F
MNTDESLSKIFDIEPMKEQEVEILPATGEVKLTSNKIESDYDTSRDNLHDLLLTGKDALEHALTVAKSSEHPRAFEVVGGLMKQLADMNQQLMDIHQQKKKLEEPAKGTTKEITTNNAIFVGSTTDLNKMIKKMTGE